MAALRHSELHRYQTLLELLHRNLKSLSLRVQPPEPSVRAAPYLLLPLIPPPLQSRTLAPLEVIQILGCRECLEYMTHTLRYYRTT